jgi:UDP-glucose 4-epimerase
MEGYKMKILVTGGAGFIGSNLTKDLVNAGHEVRVMDNLSLGVESNLRDIMKKIKLINGSITDEKLVSDAVKGCDYVFNLAAASSAPMFDEDPRKGYNVNVMGFLNVLEASRRLGIKRVMYASSSSIYGDAPLPHSENIKVVPPNFYSATKLTNEDSARLYSDVFGLETVGFRFFSVYGPNERAKGRFANIVSQFMWKIKNDEVPVIFGDGSQTRDFTYVTDITKAMILAMNAKNDVAGHFFNIGTGKRNSFNDIIDILNKIYGKNIKAKYVENPIKNYVAHTMADISKIKKMLGYKPTYTLGQGIEMIKDL